MNLADVGAEPEAVLTLRAQVRQLEAFKRYVHERLDAAGVPADPEPEQNAKHGCRIEGRLNVVLHPERKQLVEQLRPVAVELCGPCNHSGDVWLGELILALIDGRPAPVSEHYPNPRAVIEQLETKATLAMGEAELAEQDRDQLRAALVELRALLFGKTGKPGPRDAPWERDAWRIIEEGLAT